MEKETGTISIGKWADFIILEKKSKIIIKKLQNMEVQKTIWKGKIVYSIN